MARRSTVQGPRGSLSFAPLLLVAGALLLSFAPLAKAQNSIYEVVNATPDLSTLKAAIDTAGLAETLSNVSLPYTVFAPDNSAFDAALSELQLTADDLLGLPQADLQALLLYHVLPTAINSTNVPEVDTAVNTLAANYGPLTVRRTGSAVTVTSVGTTANVTTADVPASAGFAHVVDAVLLPVHTSLLRAVERTPNMTVLAAALNAANLTSVFSNPNLTYTLFAPNDAAFARTLARFNISADALLADAATLTRVLTYHVLPNRVLSTEVPENLTSVATLGGESLSVVRSGSSVSIFAKDVNATVVQADVPVGFGPRSVVHVVDWAFIPWYRTIASAAAANPDLSILTAAILAEGTYTPVVTGAAPFSGTIFAPTNAAFTALLSALGLTAEQLLADTAVLKRVLETHIVAGNALTTAGLSNGLSLTTLNNGTLTVEQSGSNPARIVAPASNATVVGRESTATVAIFVIDTVLLPANLTLSPPSAPAPPPPSPGAAASAVPSLGLLATSALAALALGLFGRQQ